MMNENLEMLGLRINKELKDRLTERANADHRSLSSYIRKVLTELVEVSDHEGGVK